LSAALFPAGIAVIDWRHWHNEPHLIGGLVLIGWLYALGIGPLRPRLAPGEPFPRAHAWRFYSALVIFYLAVGSPLDQAGEVFLLSAHMVQHQLIIYPAALLFLLGLPAWLVRPVTGRPSLRRIIGFATHPIVCVLVFTLVLSIWHHPGLYDWALRNRPVHILEHLMFFGSALWFWWPIASPSTEFPPIRPGPQILYWTGSVIGMTPLFVYLAFSDDVLYSTYDLAPRLFNDFSPLNDQVLAAAIMKIGAMAVAFIGLAFAFVRMQHPDDAVG
jgi:putative membrane protein